MCLVKATQNPPSPYFRVEEVVPETGVYRVFHAGHRVSHEALLLRDTNFPRCAQCGEDVHFEFVSSVPALEGDADFCSRKLFELPHPDEQIEDKKLA
jgi:hypothetical protein